jgi:hypothetical protein
MLRSDFKAQGKGKPGKQVPAAPPTQGPVVLPTSPYITSPYIEEERVMKL